jgi:hypothetical protein
VWPAAAADLARDGALGGIAELLLDGGFEAKAGAAVCLAAVCRHAAALGLAGWLAECGAVSAILQFVAAVADPRYAGFLMSGIMALLRETDIRLSAEDAAELAEIEGEAAALALKAAVGESTIYSHN